MYHGVIKPFAMAWIALVRGLLALAQAVTTDRFWRRAEAAARWHERRARRARQRA